MAGVAPGYFQGKLHNPHFIIGSARSGTSLLMKMLWLHPEICVYPDEADVLWHPQTYPYRSSPHIANLPPYWLDPGEFTAKSIEYRTESETRRLKAVFGAFQYLGGERCFLNKNPMLSFMLPYALELFPGARFIHIVRDGRAVVYSRAQRMTELLPRNKDAYDKYGVDYSYDNMLEASSNTWVGEIEAIDRSVKKLELEKKGAYLELKYEDFCGNPVHWLKTIAEFMGVNSREYESIELPEIKNTNYKYQDTLGADALGKIMKIMAPALKMKKYECDNS